MRACGVVYERRHDKGERWKEDITRVKTVPLVFKRKPLNSGSWAWGAVLQSEKEDLTEMKVDVRSCLVETHEGISYKGKNGGVDVRSCLVETHEGISYKGKNGGGGGGGWTSGAILWFTKEGLTIRGLDMRDGFVVCSGRPYNAGSWNGLLRKTLQGWELEWSAQEDLTMLGVGHEEWFCGLLRKTLQCWELEWSAQEDLTMLGVGMVCSGRPYKAGSWNGLLRKTLQCWELEWSAQEDLTRLGVGMVCSGRPYKAGSWTWKEDLRQVGTCWCCGASRSAIPVIVSFKPFYDKDSTFVPVLACTPDSNTALLIPCRKI